MTQVKEMSNQQLNRALAEKLGWKIREYSYTKTFTIVMPNGRIGGWEAKSEDEAWQDAPEYCTDAAASLEVQTAAIEKDYKAYIHNLNTTLYGECEDDGDYSSVSVEVTAAMLTATPRERAEAAYITLGGQ